MNTTYKRFLILFSVALNIGFIITGLFSYFSQPVNHHQRHMNYAREALKQMTLLPEQEKEMMDKIEKFHSKHDDAIRTFKQNRQKLIMLLAQPGPLDLNRFAAIEDEIKTAHVQMNQLVKDHILSVRQKLGDDKGAQFFSALLDQIKSDNRLN